ncbi:MAG: DUF922 domain-containing Zn-dependent protease [Acidobacteria bacterium]|nr:DUF922 domain-containing Zn-dependent protease [Acidobacteriota bacterium]
MKAVRNFAIFVSTIFVLALFFKLNQTPPSAYEHHAEAKYNYYTVDGDTEQELRDSLNRNGIPAGPGRSYDGYTRWYIKWNWKTDTNQNGQCYISGVDTSLDITYTLPQWKYGRGDEASLVVKWEQYIEALTLHEEGHGEHGINCEREIKEALQNLPPEDSCNSLNQKANMAAREVLHKWQRADKDYDAETGHGVTQGAKFP